MMVTIDDKRWSAVVVVSASATIPHRRVAATVARTNTIIALYYITYAAVQGRRGSRAAYDYRVVLHHVCAGTPAAPFRRRGSLLHPDMGGRAVF